MALLIPDKGPGQTVMAGLISAGRSLANRWQGG